MTEIILTEKLLLFGLFPSLFLTLGLIIDCNYPINESYLTKKRLDIIEAFTFFKIVYCL